MIKVRIDKFLKVSRLIKRRQIAKEIIESEVIFLNGKIVKPSKEISVGDIITLQLGRKIFVVRILKVEFNHREKFEEMYELIEEKVINPQE